MMEFFDQYDNEDTEGFSDFEKAMEDTVVLVAAREAKRHAAELNERSEIQIEEIESIVSKLDGMVSHVMNQQVRLSGSVKLYDQTDDSDSFFIHQTTGKFEGFWPTDRDDEISFDYLFSVPVDEFGNVIQEDDDRDLEPGQYTISKVQAAPSNVFMKFDRMHPVQARAILETAYPASLKDIDGRIIHIEDRADELALMGLRGFQITKSITEPSGEELEYTRAVIAYINGMIAIDLKIPYLVDIEGDIIMTSTDGLTFIKYENSKNMMLSVEGLTFFNSSDASSEYFDTYSLSLKGSLQSDNPDIKGSDIILPLQSVSQIQSLRRLVFEMNPSERREG
jgi:hypothetical protein